MKVGEKIDLGNGEVEVLQVLECEDCGELEVIVKHEDGLISTEYFTPADELEEEIEEVKCPCCGQLTEEKYIDEVAVEEELVDTLERIADELEEAKGFKSKKNEIIESAIITIENRQARFMNELMDDVREILKEI